MKKLLPLLVTLLFCTCVSAGAQNNQYMLSITPSGSSAAYLPVAPGQVIQFTAKAYQFTAAGTKVEVPITSLVWSVTPASFGTITAQGVFTASAQNATSPRGTIIADAVVGNLTLRASVAAVLQIQPHNDYTFSGNVSSASGPIDGAQVSVMSVSALPFLVSEKTDANGNYSIDLPAGSYIIRAQTTGFLTEYFDNASTATQATTFFTDSANPVVSNIDFILSTYGGSIAGIISDENGKPIADAIVAAWINGRPSTNAAGAAYGRATSAADGSYLIPGLPAGDFVVRAYVSGYIAEYYDDETDLKRATAVAVANQPVTGIDFALSAGGGIAGTITNEDTNAPIGQASVIVRSLQQHFERAGRTSAQGQYSIDGLPSGTYTVFASAYRFIGEYYNASNTSVVGIVTVTGTATVTGIDLALTPAPAAPRMYRGNVVARSGAAGLISIIEAINPDNGLILTTATDAEGAFEFEAWENSVLRARAVGYVGLYAGNTHNWKESRWDGVQSGVTFALDPVSESGLARFTGQINDAAGGAGVANAWVYGMDAAGSLYFAVTGPSGAFGISNTANGSLDVMVSEVGFEPVSTAAEIEDAEGSGTITAQRTVVTSVEEAAALPDTPMLLQNYPNPFNPATTISFSVPERIHVRITVFDLLGKEVAVLVNDFVDAGRHDVVWNAAKFPSGIYLYRLDAASHSQTLRMTLLK